jgi:hypothetical protein
LFEYKLWFLHHGLSLLFGVNNFLKDVLNLLNEVLRGTGGGKSPSVFTGVSIEVRPSPSVITGVGPPSLMVMLWGVARGGSIQVLV